MLQLIGFIGTIVGLGFLAHVIVSAIFHRLSYSRKKR